MARDKSPNTIIAKCASWSQFVQAVSFFSAKDKGDAFERLTQLYLQTKPEYQTSLKEVWRLADVPGRVRRKLPNLPKSDEGIDLVAETRTGEFWAVQCKYKGDKDTALTVRELSTFTNLAFNSCAGHFARALVVHSTNKPVRKHKLLGNTSEIGLQRWLELSKEEWKLIHAKLANKPLRPKQRFPRPHQQRAIAAAAEHFLKNKKTRGKLLMPCGTGKSLCAFWISQSLKSKITLVVVPSLSLVKQSVEDWTRELVAQDISPLPEWLCVCSDQSVSNVSKDKFVKNVYDLGLPVTTNQQEITAFLKKQTLAQRIVFVTYQSSPIFAKAARSAKVTIDFAIMDEAHKTAGEKSKTFSTLLFDKNLKIKRRMFMTATERVVRGANDDVVSMDDTNTYGDCLYHLSFKEAIHSKPAIISDYKILTFFVTEDEIKCAIQEQSYVTDTKSGVEAENAKYIAAAIALRKACRNFEIKHTVSFHRSIRAASDFATLQDRFNNLKSLPPNIECFHISSQKTAGERTELLENFAASERSLITNAKCLTEGVDVPAIDCVLFADPKKSTVDIVQAAGRALRPYSGKKFGYIMVPIIVPDGMSFEAFAESTDFRAVSKVITSLSTQDERIAEEFRISDKARAGGDCIFEFSGTVPVGIQLDLKDFAAAVSAKVWERVANVNWRSFEDARDFVHGLNLKSQKDWNNFCALDVLPLDIPKTPHRVYENHGWSGLGDWLGTGRVANQDREFLPFNQARAYARGLNMAGQKDWYNFTKSGMLQSDVPAYPDGVYKDDGWQGWGDWLGTGRVAYKNRQYRTLNRAKEFVHALGLSSRDEWLDFTKSGRLPSDIPASPSVFYINKGWKGWGDWLGTGSVATHQREYRPFEQARAYARSLSIVGQKEWRVFVKTGRLADDVPTNPDLVFKKVGWINWGDWLGTGSIATHQREYRPFKQARAYARSLSLSNRVDWLVFTKSGKLPNDVPAYPDGVYENDGWQGWGDWLGSGIIATHQRKYRSFVQARAYSRSLSFTCRNDWVAFSKSGNKPDDIPTSPCHVYKDTGWKGWGDWLGTDFVAYFRRQYRPFVQARAYARSLSFTCRNDWVAFSKCGNKPDDIPTSPPQVYTDTGWKGWGDWLGSGIVATRKKTFRGFEDARDFVRGLGLKSQHEWFAFSKSGNRPSDIPSNPRVVYQDKGWTSWPDWLGKTSGS